MATYIVRSGDSLSKIARDVLGDMRRWPQIAAANRLSAPYTIRAGQVLQLPEASVVPAIPGPAPGAVSQPATWWKRPALWFFLAAAAGAWWLVVKPDEGDE
jgi:LysM repeat protein